MKKNWILLLLIFVVLPNVAQAKCREFSWAEQQSKIPIIARGKILEGTDIRTLASCASQGPEKCRYRFRLQLSEVLKGSVPVSELQIEYGYASECPESDTFAVGEERIWLIAEVKDNGDAKLNGIRCGYGSRPLSELSEAQKASQ